MGKFYGLKIKNGDITVENVPKLWRKAVDQWLSENI
jgi:hypothetical protein